MLPGVFLSLPSVARDAGCISTPAMVSFVVVLPTEPVTAMTSGRRVLITSAAQAESSGTISAFSANALTGLWLSILPPTNRRTA